MKRTWCSEPGRRTVLCIGAHPDDAELNCGGTVALWAGEGDRVVLLSVTDGSSGHWACDPASLAVRRRAEARSSASAIGAESRCLGCRDGNLEPSLENRGRLIRAIREIAPDVIVTNRSNDYHPDHRYASLLVQDAAYLLAVPHVLPDVPPLRYMPLILFWADPFRKPVPFSPDVAVDVGPVFETKLSALMCHESQFFEWLPWMDGSLDLVPASGRTAERRQWLRGWLDARSVPSPADMYRSLLVGRYGASRGAAVGCCEAFEVSEYGARPEEGELALLFSGM